MIFFTLKFNYGIDSDNDHDMTVKIREKCISEKPGDVLQINKRRTVTVGKPYAQKNGGSARWIVGDLFGYIAYSMEKNGRVFWCEYKTFASSVDCD